MSRSRVHEQLRTAVRSFLALLRLLVHFGRRRRLHLILQLLRLVLVLLEDRILRRRAEFRLLGLLLLDVVERHADDGLLDLRALLRALLPGLLGLALLVLPAPVLRP